ncbi:MAG: UDP-N-acetylmuramyl-tripeptide synthetase, partial [Clostridia bacterium]|nr:UDP-N-acetylmuramyl-tripeptide synthetase [Clostridia bacterium]
MDIKNILENVNFLGVKNFNQFDVENLTCNSHDDNENGIYFCLKGTKVDGHDYIDEAKVNGAKCLVVERYLDSDLMQILVKDSRASMTEISSVYYEIPTSKMKFVGITGTNGKTTTSFLVKAYLSKLGKKVGLIGTQGVYFNKIMLPGKLTTPDPIELHRIIHEMEQNGIEYVVMEASAHAIALKKIDGLKFDTVALTNITQDHLDFFKTMENYSRAKAELFSLKHSKNAIINIDDDYCYSIANQTDCNVKTVSIYDDADYSVQDCDFSVKETKAKVRVGVEDIDLKTNLIGRYNLSNTLTALAIVESLGFSLEEVKDAV